MRFINKSGNKRLDIICSQANKLITDGSFWATWLKIKSFNSMYTNSQVTSEMVKDLLVYNMFCENPVNIPDMEVYTYKSGNPWSKANGYTLPNMPGKMWLNTRRLGRSDASIVATLKHESIHYLNAVTGILMGHGSNTPKNTQDKNNNNGCVPEIMAALVYEHLSGMISTEDSSI